MTTRLSEMNDSEENETDYLVDLRSLRLQYTQLLPWKMSLIDIKAR